MRIAPTLFRFGFLIVGAAQIAASVSDSVEATKSIHWPTTDGLVLSSTVNVTKSRGGFAYTPKVIYSYTVGIHSYTGDRIWTQEFADLSERARATSAKFPVGASVTIHYDPSAPESSLLEPGMSIFSYFWFGLAFIGSILGAASLYLGLRTTPRGSGLTVGSSDRGAASSVDQGGSR